MAPSSSGGSTVGEALNIMERYDLGAMTDTNALHHYLEASALAFADRGAYVGDPSKVDVPLSALLDDTFAAERACRISETAAATKPVAAGNPAAYDGSCATPAPGASRDDADTENISTTNMTVSDRWGNVVEYTLTIEQTGGSGIVVPGRGFLLNNELTDFSAVYDANDPNRIEPGKRPRSSMAPTLVFDKVTGQLAMSGGSPGGALIIHYTAKTVYGVLHWGLTPQQAVDLPNFGSTNGPTLLEQGRFPPDTVRALQARGHEVREMEMTSGLQAITVGNVHGTQMLLGGADPIRAGRQLLPGALGVIAELVGHELDPLVQVAAVGQDAAVGE